MNPELIDLSLTNILVTPVKSTTGYYVPSAEVGRRGIKDDRIWMAVDEKSGMFVAQRSHRGLGIAIPQICQVNTMIQNQSLFLNVPGNLALGTLTIPAEADGPRRQVQIWEDIGPSIDQGDEAALWLSEHLKHKVRLVRMADDFVRMAKMGNAEQAFHDGYGFTGHTEESHQDVNVRLRQEGLEKISMRRWRSTLIFKSFSDLNPELIAYLEDRIISMRIGKVLFEGQTLCSRCLIPDINQLTAVETAKGVRTILSQYRRGRHLGLTAKEDQSATFFSKNFVHRSQGVIKIGDRVEIISVSERKVPQLVN